MTQTLRRIFASFVAVAVLAASAGCLQMDKTHTLYVSRDGLVTWMVVERDVRSDEKDAVKAAAEEEQYIARARMGGHPVAEAFRRLGALDVSTHVVRETRPFTVITVARFTSLDALSQALIQAIGIDASSSLTTEGSRMHWALTIFSDQTANTDASADRDLLPLFDERWRVVLEQGRFVDAENFRIETSQTAIQVTDGDDRADGEPFVWSLTWTK